MSSTEPTLASLGAAISSHVVRLFAEYTGRGPTKARTIIGENVVVCVTQNSMTKAERRLVQEGESDLVVLLRRKFQAVMRDDLVGAVEAVTGRTVLAFMSDHEAGRDYAAEVFVLDGRPTSASPSNGDGEVPLRS